MIGQIINAVHTALSIGTQLMVNFSLKNSCAPAVVVCPALMDPNNGQVEPSDMVFGLTATYNWDTRYNFNGSMSHVCMAGGQRS